MRHQLRHVKRRIWQGRPCESQGDRRRGMKVVLNRSCCPYIFTGHCPLPSIGKSGWVVKAAVRATPAERAGTLPAKLHAFRILKATARAAHGCALRHGRTSNWVRAGRRRAPLISVYGLRCQYSRCGKVSSEKHETAADAGMEED